MPGKFIEEVRIYKCGQHADGTAIMCSEIGYAKIPFMLAEDPSESDDGSGSDHASESGKPLSLGWQQAGYTDVHIPLARLVTALKRFGITVSYDEEDLTRRLGPPPASE